MKKVIGTLATVVLLVLFILAARSGFRAIADRQMNAPRSAAARSAIRLLRVQTGEGTRTIPALATLKSAATIKIMPEVAGKITLLNKREGDTVTAGEVIARIESDELQTQLRVAGAQSSSVEKQTAAAEETIRSLASQRPALVANEQFWRSELERDRKLYEQGALSKAQAESTANKFAEAQGRLAALEAQVNASRAQKQSVASQKDAAAQTVALWKVRNRYAEVTAPVTGIISSRLQEEGNYVTPSSILYQLEDTRLCRLVMQIPQQYVHELQLGQVVVVDGPPPAGAPEFRLSRIYPTGNEFRQRQIEAESVSQMASPEFDRPFAVDVVTASASGVLIPADAYWSIGSGTVGQTSAIAVYRVMASQAHRLVLKPSLVTDHGDAVVEAGEVASGTKLMPLVFLQAARLPEVITFEGEVAE